MNSPASTGRPPVAIVGALILTVFSLGLAWVGPISGYVLNVRVFIVGAIVLLAVALAKRTTAPATSVNALNGAVLGLGAALALTARAIEPAALAVVALALALIVVGRQRLRST